MVQVGKNLKNHAVPTLLPSHLFAGSALLRSVLFFLVFATLKEIKEFNGV